MELDYEMVRTGLEQLFQAKGMVKVFGSEGHGFQVFPSLAEALVREFEERHSVSLPLDYRGFLIHVGNGGAGPAYGLFKLGEMDSGFGHKRWKEGDGFVGILAEPFPHITAWNEGYEQPEFDETRADDPEWETKYESAIAEWEEAYWNSANVNGAIPVCHLGCAYRQWLVITGPEAGHVWNDDRADAKGMSPLQQAGRERVTFGQWYGNWLGDALKQIRAM